MINVKVLICGGRNLNPYRVWEWLAQHLRPMLEQHFGQPVHIAAVIEGNQTGGDEGAGMFAIASEPDGTAHVQVPADWITYGMEAGSIRNRQMILACHPDIIVAFPGYTGTSNMLATAEGFGIPTFRIRGDFR